MATPEIAVRETVGASGAGLGGSGGEFTASGGASGDVRARGPGFLPDLSPPAPCFHPVPAFRPSHGLGAVEPTGVGPSRPRTPLQRARWAVPRPPGRSPRPRPPCRRGGSSTRQFPAGPAFPSAAGRAETGVRGPGAGSADLGVPPAARRARTPEQTPRSPAAIDIDCYFWNNYYSR